MGKDNETEDERVEQDGVAIDEAGLEKISGGSAPRPGEDYGTMQLRKMAEYERRLQEFKKRHPKEGLPE